MLVSPVYGASVTISPRASTTNPGITIVTGPNVGNVNITKTMILVGFNTSATTSTIFIDARTFEYQEPSNTLYFQTKSFGNGTMTIKVASNLVPKIQGTGFASGSTSCCIPFITTITYTANQSNSLLLVFQQAASTVILTGLFVFASIIGLVLILIYLRPSLNLIGVDTHNRSPMGHEAIGGEFKDRTKIAIMLLVITVLAAIVAFMVSGLGG